MTESSSLLTADVAGYWSAVSAGDGRSALAVALAAALGRGLPLGDEDFPQPAAPQRVGEREPADASPGDENTWLHASIVNGRLLLSIIFLISPEAR